VNILNGILKFFAADKGREFLVHPPSVSLDSVRVRWAIDPHSVVRAANENESGYGSFGRSRNCTARAAVTTPVLLTSSRNHNIVVDNRELRRVPRNDRIPSRTCDPKMEIAAWVTRISGR
jgi:hypothetical protein